MPQQGRRGVPCSFDEGYILTTNNYYLLLPRVGGSALLSDNYSGAVNLRERMQWSNTM